MSMDTKINETNPSQINNPVSQNDETKVQASTNGRKIMDASRYVLSGGLAIAAVVAAIALTILFAPAALAVVGTIGVSVLAAVAGATAIVTAAVACGLFFGGRNIQAKADAKAEAETKAAAETKAEADAKAAGEAKAAAEAETKAAAEKKAKAEARAKILAAATPETIEEMVEDLIEQAGAVFEALDDKSSKAEKYKKQVTTLFAEANATEVFETLLKAAEPAISASAEELENAKTSYTTAREAAKEELTLILTEEAAKAKAASDVPSVVDAEAASDVPSVVDAEAAKAKAVALLIEFNKVARGYRDAITVTGKSEDELKEIYKTIQDEINRVGELFKEIGEEETYSNLLKDALTYIDAQENEQLKKKFIETRDAAIETLTQKFLRPAVEAETTSTSPTTTVVPPVEATVTETTSASTTTTLVPPVADTTNTSTTTPVVEEEKSGDKKGECSVM